MVQSEFAQLAVLKKQDVIRNEHKNMQSSLKWNILILFVFKFQATVIFSLFPLVKHFNLSFFWMSYNLSLVFSSIHL